MLPKRDERGFFIGLSILALAYWALAVISLQWAQVSGAGSPVWPAAGVALAGLLLGGLRLWPAIVIGRLAAAVTVGSEHSIWVESAIAAVNALAAVLPAYLLQRWSRLDLRLTRMRDVLWLSLAATLSAVIAAVGGTGALWLSIDLATPRVLAVGGGWLFGNLVGILTVAPLVLAWWLPDTRRLTAGAWAHLAALVLVTGIVSHLLFLTPAAPEIRVWYIYPILIWAALAFQVRGAAAVLTVTSGYAIWGATLAVGPFGDAWYGVLVGVFLAQQFSAVTSFTILLLAAVSDERRGKEALRQSEERLRRRSEQLHGLAEAAPLVARGPTLRETLDETAEAARRIIGTHQAVVSLSRGPDWSQSISAIALSDKYARWRGFDAAPDGTGIYALVCETNRSIRMTQAELEAHPRWRGFGAHAGEHPPMRGWLAAPLIGRDGRNLGLIQVSDKHHDAQFDETDEAVLVHLAQLASAALEQSEIDEALRQLNAELECKVEERTSELVQLQKVEIIGRLTGGIAHDFNNLLMAVLGSLELLRKRLPADSEMLRHVDNAVQGAERGVGLTRRLLAFARKQDLSPVPVDVPELVAGMVDLLKRTLGPQIEIETRFAEAVPKALIDPNQLELAILNLAVNASDAMPEGGLLTILVEPGRQNEGVLGGHHVRLVLSDTGTGMDEETLKHAAEPFFTTKGTGKGTGLGLPMVVGWVGQSGGHFELTSTPGEGTTAEMLLPVAGAAEGPSPGNDSSERRARRDDRGPLSVLVVDDDSLVLMGASALVEDLGHSVVEAISAQQALEVLNGGRAIDVVITDQAMPGTTGLQLAQKIRAEWPNVAVILATGYAELPEGADEVVHGRLNKPFLQPALAEALENALARCRG